MKRVKRVMKRVLQAVLARVSAGQRLGEAGEAGEAGESVPTHESLVDMTYTQNGRPVWKTTRDAPSPASLRRGGAVTSDGRRHQMVLAFPSQSAARAYKLSRNHHVRVWCSCMEDAASPAGTYAGQHATVVNDRTSAQAAHDPRRVGGWDWLGVADVRVPGSALDLFRAHLRDHEERVMADTLAAAWAKAEDEFVAKNKGIVNDFEVALAAERALWPENLAKNKGSGDVGGEHG